MVVVLRAPAGADLFGPHLVATWGRACRGEIERTWRSRLTACQALARAEAS